MSELLEPTNVSVDVENDVVVFRVGRAKARFSYSSAFMIAQEMRLAAGVAGRAAGIPIEERQDLKRQPSQKEVRPVDTPDALDASEAGALRWRVTIQGELVCLQIGSLVARWEAGPAMQIAAWFREGGRQAKRWAGDSSKTLRLAGILTDAAENTRLTH